MRTFLLWLLPVLGIGLSACAPTMQANVPAITQEQAAKCPAGKIPVTGVAVQNVFDGDYGSLLSRHLPNALTDAGFHAVKSTDYPAVNTTSIQITGLIDHWANTQDQLAPFVGHADLLITDRRTQATLNRIQVGMGAGDSGFGLLLPNFIQGVVAQVQQQFCQV